jgi:hypothetical protein
MKPLMGDLGGLHEFGIAAIGHIDETYVVVFAVHPAEDGLIAPGGAVRPEAMAAYFTYPHRQSESSL